MADVKTRLGDRGQLLIITALALAVMLALMALALNTAVFGGVYAAQADESLHEERGALQFQDAVHRGVQGLIQELNQEHVEYVALESGLTGGVKNWSELARREYAREDVSTNASLLEMTFETKVIQNNTQDFTDHSNQSSWTVAENVSSVNAFELTVSNEALANSSNCFNDSSCYTLTVDSDNATWEMVVNTTANSTIETTVQSSGTTEQCETTDSPVVINVTGGVFDPGGADECSFTSVSNDTDITPPYTVTYSNAKKINGTYELTVHGRITNGSIEDDERYETTGSPRLEPRIERADVSVRYRSIDLTYRTILRVTPGGET